MKRLETLPDITDPRYKPIWDLAVVRAAKRKQSHPAPEEIIDVFADLLPKFTELDGTINLQKKAFKLALPHVYPEAPGLILREMNLDDIEQIIPRMAYATPELARQAVMVRFKDPFTQCLAWEYKRRLIQTESLRLRPDNSVEIGTSVHVMKRSGAFWREIEKPVFERLAALGVNMVHTFTLNTLLKYWKPIIVEFYKGSSSRVSPLTTQFSYPLDLSVFTGWPERRSAGANWEYSAEGMTFREMSVKDLPTVLKELRVMHRLGESAADQLDEKFMLDRGAVLLGYKDGVLTTIRAIRPHRTKSDKGVYSLYNKITNSREEKITRWVFNIWAQLLGYKTIITFINEDHKTKSQIGKYVESQEDLRVAQTYTEFGMKWYVLESTVADSIARGIK